MRGCYSYVWNALIHTYIHVKVTLEQNNTSLSLTSPWAATLTRWRGLSRSQGIQCCQTLGAPGGEANRSTVTGHIETGLQAPDGARQVTSPGRASSSALVLPIQALSLIDGPLVSRLNCACTWWCPDWLLLLWVYHHRLNQSVLIKRKTFIPFNWHLRFSWRWTRVPCRATGYIICIPHLSASLLTIFKILSDYLSENVGCNTKNIIQYQQCLLFLCKI